MGEWKRGVCQGVTLRHDHGSQYVSRYFSKRTPLARHEILDGYVAEPEGNGVAEWFIRTLEERVI
ncbi:MAG: hypothetical protein HPY90_13420 [Syntrophothermus sp.]|uniref:hypothetical protein n=1 Tax=Syntrophothermus sp. TaxID=2736299 RepID=UPI00257C69CD|nr:hypothetical protein [Syntrophothermus sp.]NSW84246.1 hypothetical protein [Syntrophothermus sp.]